MAYFYYEANDKLDKDGAEQIGTDAVAFVIRKIVTKITRKCTVERSNALRAKADATAPPNAVYQYGQKNHFDFIKPQGNLATNIRKKGGTNRFVNAFTPLPDLTDAYKEASAFDLVRRGVFLIVGIGSPTPLIAPRCFFFLVFSHSVPIRHFLSNTSRGVNVATTY